MHDSILQGPGDGEIIAARSQQEVSEDRKSCRLKLGFLDAALALTELTLPGLRLEKLSGNHAGQYSIRVYDQYRVCFRWKEGDAYEVEVTDYH